MKSIGVDFLCCEVNPSGLWRVSLLWSQSRWIWYKENILEIEILHWILVVPMILRFQKLRCSMAWLQVCTSKDVAGIERVLDTDGYISFSRMLRPCHGCFGPGIWSFQRKLDYQVFGQSIDDDVSCSCCYWAELCPIANEVSSPDLPKTKENRPRWLVLFMQIILNVVKSHIEVIESEMYHHWYCWRVHCISC